MTPWMALRRAPLPLQVFVLRRVKGVSVLLSETLHRRDAVSELLHKSRDGLTACFGWGFTPEVTNRRHKKSAPKCAFLDTCVSKSRLV